MKIEIKKIDAAKKELNIEASGDIVRMRFEEVFKKIGKEAKVKGFRQGNVPRDILEKEYSGLAHEQVLKELIPDVYNEAVKNENLDVVGLPQITEVKLDRNTLSFKAAVETSPEIKLKNYKGIKLIYKKIAATGDEVKRQLDSIKEARKADVLDDNFAKVLSYPDLTELEKAIERQILVQKDSSQVKKIEETIIENITKDADFKVPQSLVDRQLQNLLRQAKVDLAMKGLPHDKINEQEEMLIKELTPQAISQVKVYLILAEIAKKENMPQDDHMPHKVMEFLLKEADWKIEE